MRSLLVAVCLLLAVPADAASKRQCLSACASQIAACQGTCGGFGVPEKQCRKAVLRACRRGGLGACGPTFTLHGASRFDGGTLISMTICASSPVALTPLDFIVFQDGRGTRAIGGCRTALDAGACINCSLEVHRSFASGPIRIDYDGATVGTVSY